MECLTLPRSLGSASAAFAVLAALAIGGCARSPLGYNATLDERECLARAMYFESNRSSGDGMLAVGTVVMNRLQSSRYPKTVCGVVGQERQFADGALSKPVAGRSYAKALDVADAVLAGERHDQVGAAMFFHTAGYPFPYRNMAYVAKAGGNVFYEKKEPGSFVPIKPHTLVARDETDRAASRERVRIASERTSEREAAPNEEHAARPRERRAETGREPEPGLRGRSEERRPAPGAIRPSEGAAEPNGRPKEQDRRTAEARFDGPLPPKRDLHPVEARESRSASRAAPQRRTAETEEAEAERPKRRPRRSAGADE